jgi:hypothetical protein
MGRGQCSRKYPQLERPCMNEKIANLIKESDLEECIDDAYLMRDDWQPFIEKFAELIVKECTTILRDTFDCYFEAEQIEEHFGVE